MAGASFAFVLGTAAAQTPGAIQQVDNTRQQNQLVKSAKSLQDGDSAPELYADESSDLGPQTVLKPKLRHTLFEAMVDAQYFYTDNMFLNEQGRHGADVLVSTAQFAIAPTPYDFANGKLASRIGYQHQWFDFGLGDKDKIEVFDFTTSSSKSAGLNLFDFNAQTAFTDVQWSRDNWTVEAGFDFRRLLSTANYEEFYKEYVPRWSVQKLVPVGQKAAVIIGYAGDYRFGKAQPFVFVPPSSSTIRINPDLGDRTDHTLFLTYNRVLCRQAVFQPYYQIKYTHFVDSTIGRRNDLLSSVGAAVYWTVCPNFEMRAFVDYTMRFSDNSVVSEYSQFDGGLGVNATFRF